MIINIEHEISFPQMIEYLQGERSRIAILEALNLTSSEILGVYSIEELTRQAFDDDPEQVRENLLEILDLNNKEYDPHNLSSVKQFVRQFLLHIPTKLFLTSLKEVIEANTDWKLSFTKELKI
jgi:hypothetical protein